MNNHKFQSNEFKEFVNVREVSPPLEVEQKVLSFVKSRLHPTVKLVFLKLVITHAASGLFLLLICPQFGLTLLAKHGILHWLAMFNQHLCTIVCGALFLGVGAMVASFYLTPEELKVVRRYRFLYFPSLGLLALALFYIFGAEIALGAGLIWLVGSIGGEALGLELGWKLRCLGISNG